MHRKPSNQPKGHVTYCKCRKCGYKVEHKVGKPCMQIKCPKCNSSLTLGN